MPVYDFYVFGCECITADSIRVLFSSRTVWSLSLFLLLPSGAIAICFADPTGPYCAEENQEIIHNAGDSLVFQVFLDSDPNMNPTNISWRHFNTDITNGSRRYFQDGNRRLMIESLRLEDIGVYSATAVKTVRGSVQNAMTMVTLSVLGMLILRSCDL
jgi:hypothetical protein